MLVYHAILYQEYGLPVISIIIYPFRTTVVTPPWEEKSEDETILTFNFKVLPLYDLEAEKYLREHLTCMYPLLPTMQGVTAEMMIQAMEELAQLYRQDEVTLAQQFVWMELLLSRAAAIPKQQKQEIQRRLSMYDQLWEEHPKVKQIRAESKAEGKVEGLRQGLEKRILEGEVKALRSSLVIIVKAKFPDLLPLAKVRATQIKEPETLNEMLERISTASDEQTALSILRDPVA